MILNKGQTITTADGRVFVIKEFLGEGGQGEVYLVSNNKETLAFKLYKEIPDSDFIYNLKTNISKGSPSSNYLWPLSAIEFEDGKFGYLMDLRPKNYKSFVSYLNAKVGFKDTRTLLKWCIELCISFKKLHEMGYSYQDLNDGSFFLDPDTGDLLICDNDNVTANKKNLGILGKMRYMAPEIVRGDSLPDIHSDRFSLAVILFLALCMGNPYEGERLKNYEFIDEEAELELFGKKPVFVYHKTDKSNRPIRGYHTSLIKRWPIVPLYIKEAFHRTFVDGLVDRENERTTELEWIKLLTKYRDELISCSCGRQYIYGIAENKEINCCPYCNSKKPERTILRVNRWDLLLEPGAYLYETHLDKYSSNYNNVVGKVIQNKKNPSIWGIKVITDHDIEIKDNQGNVKVIQQDPGVIPIVTDLKIKFSDNSIGEIRKA